MADKRPHVPRTRGSKRRRSSGSKAGPLAGDRKGQRLHEILEAMVAAAEPGQRLPSERELAARYEVARMTVRGVIDRLVLQGLVHRVHGHGTFVSEPRVAQPADLTSFTEDMAVRGLTPSTTVLTQEVLTGPEPVARQLELAPSDPVLHLERVRSGDDEPVALEHSHLPARRFPGLEAIDLASRSLYETLATDYGCEPANSHQRIAAVSLTEAEAELLQAPAAAPALRIERITRDRDGRVIEFVRSVYRGDRFELHTEQLRSVDTRRGTTDQDRVG